MSHEQQEVAEQIRTGKYFEEARAWYQTLYIGPISERAFFLIVGVLAGLIALVGIVAFAGLMPVTEHPGLLVSTQQPEIEKPVINRMRQRGQPLAVAMERFLLQSYVERRESYKWQEFETNMNFIRAHSDGPTFAGYEAIYGQANPRSPVNILGERGLRKAQTTSLHINEAVEPKIATVKFSTELEGVGTQAKTQWTATLGYYYSPMQVTEVTNSETGELSVVVEDPQLKVVNYAVTQTP